MINIILWALYCDDIGPRVFDIVTSLQLANDPKHTSRPCGVHLTKKRDGVLRQMSWPSSKPRWDGLGWVGPQSESSQQVLSTFGNPYKTVGKPLKVLTSWIWLRECQECAKLSSTQYMYCSGLFNTFLFVIICSFIVCMSSVFLYNVENKDWGAFVLLVSGWHILTHWWTTTKTKLKKIDLDTLEFNLLPVFTLKETSVIWCIRLVWSAAASYQ